MTNKLITGKLYLFKKTYLHYDFNSKDFVAIFLGYKKGNKYELKCLEQDGKISCRIDTWWDAIELK